MFIQLRRRQRFVQPGPPAVPRLELGAGQERLDPHHPLAEVVEGAAIGVSGALEMQSDLEPAATGMVPGLVVDLWMPVVELEERSVAPAGLERLQVSREPGFDAFAQPREELGRSHGRGSCQPLEYIS